MLKEHPFTIYNASAGSGKTFTLVKEYLKLLFASNYPDYFKHSLAITFTNKAVGEMKERIIDTLKQFSNPDILKAPNSIFKAIVDELPISELELHKKSKTILHTILHNYAAFDISTIDGFNHRLIRTFAYDLKLPLNFEVELDTKSILNEAVDSLIAKAGTDKKLTKVLIDFALEKADDDKSWDISRDFNTIALLLINENDLKFVKTLEDKTLDDFNALKTNLKKQIRITEQNLVNDAENLLQTFADNGIEANDFSGGYVYKHFVKLSNKIYNLSFDTKWQEDVLSQNKPLYPKRVSDEAATSIDSLQPKIAAIFSDTKAAVYQLKFLKACYKNSTPLSVLNAIHKELQFLKADQNKMLISEFNAIISSEIKNQPTPFIYERLGEKYRHYFIDEFQDTSQLQWENLIPLIENTLVNLDLKGNQGTAMLVGDAKQAIYRWRGGKAEQFIGLFHEDNPFPIDKNIVNLPVNYRSCESVVSFNNRFFEYLAKSAFSSTNYSDLYGHAKQKSFIKNTGYVSLDFIDFEKEDDKNEIYPQNVLSIIEDCLKNKFQLKDICVLVRKKKEGIAVANYLSEHQIKITSSETMLISNSPEVNFINNLIRLLVTTTDTESKLHILEYLAEKYTINNTHNYLKTHLSLDIFELFKSFETLNIVSNPIYLTQLGLYDMVESIIRDFKLIETSNAYIQFYLDTVLDFMQKNNSSATEFLEYFEKKKDVLSIVSPANQNAVQIMTIHKSKGLEFPIVIFPYADLDIYREIEPKEWFPLNENNYQGFSHTLLNYNKDFEFYGDDGLAIHNNHQAELELDNLNLLYVALTRPVEQLYIIAKKDISAKGIANKKNYSGLLIDFLIQANEWNENQLHYTYGNPKKTETKEQTENHTIEQTEFISTAKEDHNIKIITKSGYLWDTEQQAAIEKGNLIHDIMAHIYTKKDIKPIIANFLESGIINQEQAEHLQTNITQLVEHTQLKNYFNDTHTIYNEKDIITKTGQIYRPDRLVINNKNETVIIDYKTGLHNPKYQHQLQDYQDVLEDMQFKVTKKILIYINEDLKIVTY